MVPGSFWIVLTVIAIMCSIGFYKFYYFLSVGYGFAISGAGLTILLIYGPTLTPITIITCSLFILYGLRLGGFLLYREFKSLTYRKKIIDTTVRKPAPILLKTVMWICVSLMYIAQVSPVYYRAVNGDHFDIYSILGTIIMLIGVIVETLADQQKNEAKKKNPNRFCDQGLYKIVRCPNYLGEVLFWSGVLVCGINALEGTQWILALIGYVLIVYVMLSGSKRLEHRQNEHYGNDPQYQEYVNKTPILFPFIPLYHLQKCKFIIE